MDSLNTMRTMGAALNNTESAAGIMFVLEAEAENSRLDDITIAEHASYFREWDEHYTGTRGQIVREDGLLYKALHDITTAYSAMRPSESATLWKVIGDPGAEFPAWSQPISGVDNPYMKGDKVTHAGRRWVSDMDDNWYEPGAYGWTEVTG